ncbi:MAG: hypothetical protein NTY51_09020 [Deltaproteobacteria bacterium]|nr:hypothetical protein [Deltaproteobacteria bacterium]
MTITYNTIEAVVKHIRSEPYFCWRIDFEETPNRPKLNQTRWRLTRIIESDKNDSQDAAQER